MNSFDHTDQLHRFIFDNTAIRGNVVRLQQTLGHALQHHHYPLAVKKLLGELMAASALLTATLKINGSLIMQIQGTGALKLLVVECNSDFGIRATAKINDEIPTDQALLTLIGQGQFVITLDPKDSDQTYQSIVPLEGNSIGDMLENYMLRSEQIDTKIWLCCDGASAAGMLIQKLPETMNQTTTLRDLDAWDRINHLAGTVSHDELLKLPAETLLTRLFHQEEIRLFEAHRTQFFCGCSRASVSNMLKMLGDAELTEIIEERGVIEVHCDFCNSLYTFDQVDTAQLLTVTTAPVTSNSLH